MESDFAFDFKLLNLAALGVVTVYFFSYNDAKRQRTKYISAVKGCIGLGLLRIGRG